MTHSFLPGPADVSPATLAAQARPILPQNSPEFEDLFRRTEEKAQRIFRTHSPVFLAPWGTTELQEVALRNLVADKALVCINGALSGEWLQTAQDCGKQAGILEVEWGQPIRPEKLREALQKEDYEAVVLAHVEPSTGVLNPLAELSQAVAETSPETLLLVDGFASLGGVTLDFDAWGLDFVCAPSFTCLGLPPGISFFILSNRALEKATKTSGRGLTTDFLEWDKARRKGRIPTIFPTTLLYAWDHQSEQIVSGGINERYRGYEVLSLRIRDWLTENGLTLCAGQAYQSPTVMCVRSENTWTVAALIQFLMQRGLKIANGQGNYLDKTFRIALMGEVNDQDVDFLLAALADFLKSR